MQAELEKVHRRREDREQEKEQREREQDQLARDRAVAEAVELEKKEDEVCFALQWQCCSNLAHIAKLLAASSPNAIGQLLMQRCCNMCRLGSRSGSIE